MCNSSDGSRLQFSSTSVVDDTTDTLYSGHYGKKGQCRAGSLCRVLTAAFAVRPAQLRCRRVNLQQDIFFGPPRSVKIHESLSTTGEEGVCKQRSGRKQTVCISTDRLIPFLTSLSSTSNKFLCGTCYRQLSGCCCTCPYMFWSMSVSLS
jgi:hypothetical protein